MTVRKIADLQEEELDECESVLLSKQYSQQYLYVKMTSKLVSKTVQTDSEGPSNLEKLKSRLKKDMVNVQDKKMASAPTKTRKLLAGSRPVQQRGKKRGEGNDTI